MRSNSKLKKLFYLLILLSLLFLSGCKTPDNKYLNKNETYVFGWVLHNVNNSTPTELNFTTNDVGIYNTIYNYPADTPELYLRYFFWIHPGQFIAGSDNIEFPVKVNRTYYIGHKGFLSNYYNDKNNWSFHESVYINYENSSDYSSSESNALSAFYSLNPKANENKTFYFGDAPYKLPQFKINEYSALEFQGNVLMDKSKEIFLIGNTYPQITNIINSQNYGESSSEWDINWNSNSDIINYLDVDSNYSTKIYIPSNYPVWNVSIITMKYSGKNLSQVLPIQLKFADVKPYFEYNKNYSINLYFTNVQNISVNYTAEIFYSFEDEYLKLNGTIENYSFNGLILVNNESYSNLKLKINITDEFKNEIIYEINPIALKAKELDFNLQASYPSKIKPGTNIEILGSCEESINKEKCSGLTFEISLDNSTITRDYTSWPNWLNANPAVYSSLITIPDTSLQNSSTINLIFNGAGIYLPTTQSISFNIERETHDLKIITSNISIENTTSNIIANGTIKNIGKITENNVQISFYLEDNKVNSTNISSLAPNEEYNFSIKYLPTEYKRYQTTLKINTIPGEIEINDNEVSTYLEYYSSLVFNIYNYWQNIYLLNETSEIELEITNYGDLNTGDLNIQVYEYAQGNYNQKKFIKSFNITNLGYQDKYTLVFNWTPENLYYNYLYITYNNTNNVYGYNSTSYSLYVRGDEPDIDSYYTYARSFIRNQEQEIKLIVENKGLENATNVNIYIYEINESDENLTLIYSSLNQTVPGYKSAQNYIEKDFNYTLTTNEGNLILRTIINYSSKKHEDTTSFRIISDVVDFEPSLNYQLEGNIINSYYYIVNNSYNLTGQVYNFGIQNGTVEIKLYSKDEYCEYGTESNFTNFTLIDTKNLSVNALSSTTFKFENIKSLEDNEICYKINATSNLDTNLKNNIYHWSYNYYTLKSDLSISTSNLIVPYNKSYNISNNEIINEGLLATNYTLNYNILEVKNEFGLYAESMTYLDEIESENISFNITSRNLNFFNLTIIYNSTEYNYINLPTNNENGVNYINISNLIIINENYIQRNSDNVYYYFTITYSIQNNTLNGEVDSFTTDTFSLEINPITDIEKEYRFYANITSEDKISTNNDYSWLNIYPDKAIISSYFWLDYPQYDYETYFSVKTNDSIEITSIVKNTGFKELNTNLTYYYTYYGLMQYVKNEYNYLEEVEKYYNFENGINHIETTDNNFTLILNISNLNINTLDISFNGNNYTFSPNSSDAYYLLDNYYFMLYLNSNNLGRVYISKLNSFNTTKYNISAQDQTYNPFNYSFDKPGIYTINTFEDGNNSFYGWNSKLNNFKLRLYSNSFCVFSKKPIDRNKNYLPDECESDIDGDGKLDIDEKQMKGEIIGNKDTIISNIRNISINIGEQLQNESQNYTSTEQIEIKDLDTNEPIILFEFDFSNSSLDLSELEVEINQTEELKSYTIVKGLNLTNTTKTIYLEKISNTDKICVKDAEIDNISQISSNCNETSEYIILCDGSSQTINNYTCLISGNYYILTGLKHSGVIEYGTSTTTTSSSSNSGGGGGGSSSKNNIKKIVDELVVKQTNVYNKVLSPSTFFLTSYEVLINGENNLNKNYSGINKIKIKDKLSFKYVIEFEYNFSESELDLKNINLYSGNNNGTNYLIVKNLYLANNTKTLTLQKNINSEYVCIKDSSVNNINEISQNCNQENEYLLKCDGLKQYDQYVCNILDTTYIISGLKHSAVKEYYYQEPLNNNNNNNAINSPISSNNNLEPNNNYLPSSNTEDINNSYFVNNTQNSENTLLTKIKENILIVSIITAILLLCAIIFILKRKSNSKKEIVSSNYTQEYYKLAKEYVQKNKSNYNKEILYTTLKNASYPEETLNRVFNEEYPNTIIVESQYSLAKRYVQQNRNYPRKELEEALYKAGYKQEIINFVLNEEFRK